MVQWYSAYFDRSHESYQSAVEIDRKMRTFLLLIYNECVTAMIKVSPGEIICLVHIADQFDKAPVTKGIDAWKYYQYNPYQDYNHIPDIVFSVNGLSARQLMASHCAAC